VLACGREAELGEFEDACLGIILGEAASNIDDWPAFLRIPPWALARTCSFAVARDLALHHQMGFGSLVCDAWFRARDLMRQPSMRIPAASLKAPWEVMFCLLRLDAGESHVHSGDVASEIVAACLEIHSVGCIQDPGWENLVAGVSELREIRTRMTGPREERVLVLESALDSIGRSRVGPAIGGFLSGYLTSLLAEGTLEHGAILHPRVKAFPTALLWYGFCAGLCAQSKLKSYLGGVGRRILRDLLRSEGAIDRPTCDISLPELEVVMMPENAEADVRVSIPGFMAVELAPSVVTVLKLPQRELPLGGLFPGPACPSEAQDSIAELQSSIERSASMCRKLASLIGSGRPRLGVGPRGSRSRRK
jgi:hypothetical protein